MNRWSSMHERVEAYLHARRNLGYALRIEGWQLQQFARFAEQHGHHGPLTVDLALAWASDCRQDAALCRARRLEVVRPLAKFCALFEADTEIPPSRLLGRAHRRVTPHIYSEQELVALLDAAKELHPKGGLRPATMHCLFGLLAATGLRVSEALRLHRADVDLDQGVLTVRETKFRKSRYVPLHPTTRKALGDYAYLRDQCVPLARDPGFFLLDDGRACHYCQALYAFQRIRVRLGWNTPHDHPRPRLYDLRHSFACHRLLGWYREGVDVDWAMPLLATYLGHGKITDTYWYLTGIPALMAVAAERFERLGQGGES